MTEARLSQAFTQEVDALQILHRLFRALGQEGVHIPVRFPRDNVLPFILGQAFYLQLTSFIYLIFACYVSDFIARNGLTASGALRGRGRRRGAQRLLCARFQVPARPQLQSTRLGRPREETHKCCS